MKPIQQLITDHIDIWTAAEAEKKSGRGRNSGNSESVYGVKKLRELILELAVRGKLVPQDPDDEPARDLLKRIQVEKYKLIANGAIKKDKTLQPITDNEEILFNLPSGWAWARLGEVCSYIQRGKSPVYTEKSDFTVISQKCVRWAGLDLSQSRHITPETIQKYEEQRLLRENDILWNSTGTGTIGRACCIPKLIGNKILVADSHVTVVRPIILSSLFVLRWIQSPSVQSKIEGVASGTTNQIELNTSTVVSHLLPLPPLNEQNRIVAKIDELMTLCDQLEFKHNNSAEAHEKLVGHLLSTLTQSKNAEDFNESWQRIAAHFDILFTTESSIDALEQAILQLAVMGKLVKQDQSDQPASELLKKIQSEKTKLLNEGKNKKENKLTPIKDTEVTHEIPQNWAWCRLGDIADIVRGGSPRPAGDPKYYDGNIPFLKVGDLTGYDDIYVRTHSFSIKETGLHKTRLVAADTLMLTNSGATLGIPRICTFPTTFNDGIAAFLNLNYINKIYLYYFLKSKTAWYLKEASRGQGQPNLNTDIIASTLFCLPPINEQNRIVAKIEKLMAICNQLKSHITSNIKLQQKLADSLIAQAVS